MRRLVAVTGGRTYSNWTVVHRELFSLIDGIENVHDWPHILVGDAQGADKLVRETCKSLGIAYDVFYADWHKWGKAAGPKRNQEIIDCEPQLLIAFPGGRGTADMISRAECDKIEIRKILE